MCDQIDMMAPNLFLFCSSNKMAQLVEQQPAQDEQQRRPRLFRDRSNPLEFMDDIEIYMR